VSHLPGLRPRGSELNPPPQAYLSLVIPAFDEEERLPGTLAGWQAFLATQAYPSELLVVDDGSTDATAEVAQAAGARVLQLPVNQGKGAAVRAGMLDAGGRWLAYVDADLNVSPEHVPQALRLLEEGGADVVVGRRSLAEYGRAEGPKRLLAGGLVQLTRRTLALTAVRDTQCGFKVFRRGVARAIFQRAQIRSFAFDIEVLFLADKLGAHVVELPVKTEYRAGSTFDPSRHLGPFLADIARIRLNDAAGRYRTLRA
jgi:glycosyltransferase involved in cell wall biosynthesis